MAWLFLIYVICLLLILWQKRNAAFGLLVMNIALGLLMLLHHATDLF